MERLYLASQSPRRKELLAALGVDFVARGVATDESYPENLSISQIPNFIAEEKAKVLWESLSAEEAEQAVIIAADTVVVYEQQIYGKPKDEAEAMAFLTRFSGAEHEVITGGCLYAKAKAYPFSATTKVLFRPLLFSEIDYYIQQFKPFDKAGAYGIQEWIGMIGIQAIEGDFYNVMGLPVGELWQVMRQHFPQLLPGQNKEPKS